MHISIGLSPHYFKFIMQKKLIVIASLFLFSCSYLGLKKGPPSLPDDLDDAINSSSRADENVERDEYQNPKETLEFFGISPQMTVIEISPGAGYFAEILAPYLAKEGQYVIAVPRMPSNPPASMIENEKKLQDILLRHQEVQAKAKLIPFEPISARNKIKPASADMVLTFNNVHNWVATDSVTMSFKFFYDVLKPGGVLGLVQHRAPEGKKIPKKSGYITEKKVIAMAQVAGLTLVQRSEINANAKDTADYPGGVWTLPPFYRLGDKDRSRYQAIGESDRMTLKFIKKVK